MSGTERFVILEDMLAGGEPRSRRYQRPAGSVVCAGREDLAAFFEAIEAWQGCGLPVLLLLDYEFGNLLDGAAASHAAGARGHVAQALAFESVQAGTTRDVDAWIEQELEARHAGAAPAGVAAVEATVARNEYDRRFEQVQQFIRDGHTYQINLTFPLQFRWFGDPLALYRLLRRRQKVSYGALIELPDRTIVSLSPELFIRRHGQTIQTRPMKGTRPRGANAEQDRHIADEMRADPKSRAENLMIVDLLRNDLGRVCEVGSVQVRSLFDVETFATVLQMTSTVQARLPAQTRLETVLRALFPCGSVTGAPKHRSRQIIAQLEQRARGIYTGSIGYLDPDGDFSLNVAIRTLELDPDMRGRLGIGGGLVADSTAPDEWNECFIKARFLTQSDPGFELIETMRADLPAERPLSTDPSAWIALWDQHRKRLQQSAAYFGYRFSPAEVANALIGSLATLPAGPWRVRATLNKAGEVNVSAEALVASAEGAIPAVRIASSPIASHAWHQGHKTTYRPHYDPGLQLALSEGLWDLLFFNERDELVEGARSSAFVRLDGRLCTPPLESGALPGVMRAKLLADPAAEAVERTIRRQDLARSRELYLCNAVRGLFQVRWVS
ncbi:MAG TPA: aminodeoxychorismate synthase component I [Burkholderiaceae bacterium]